jgi:exopolysaccharide biosynthesis polyprenyl glycosylphosphotransferase
VDVETETINVAAADAASWPADPPVQRSAARAATDQDAGGSHRLRWWRDALRRRFLALADLVAAGVTTLLAIQGDGSALVLFAGLPLWILVAKMLGLYDRDHIALRHLTADEIPTIVAWMTVGVGALALVCTATGIESLTPRAALIAWLGGTLTAVVLRAIVRSAWRRIVPPELTLIVGERDLAAGIARRIQIFGDMHLKVVGGGPAALARNGDQARHLRKLVDGVDRVIVASREIGIDPVAELATECRERQVKLSVVSPLRGRAGPMPYLSQVADLPVLEFDTSDVSRSTMLLKRGFDIVISAAGLIVFAPLFPLVALAIKLDSPGPVIFSQLRAGLNGRPFRMYKLRSMRRDAEDQLGDLVDFDALPRPAFKLRDDPRVTRFGRLLRRFSLDELPQLWNVLRGEMSIVGPRPEELALVERYEPEHRFRLQVKPGMTGPMQVFGRGELAFDERLAVELDYVEKISLARDLWILLQTLPVTLRGTGAY